MFQNQNVCSSVGCLDNLGEIWFGVDVHSY